MSYKILLLGISFVSIVGSGIYAIYTSSKPDNKKIEIPDVVNLGDWGIDKRNVS